MILSFFPPYSLSECYLAWAEHLLAPSLALQHCDAIGTAAESTLYRIYSRQSL